jgi:hypothetical protein
MIKIEKFYKIQYFFFKRKVKLRSFKRIKFMIKMKKGRIK